MRINIYLFIILALILAGLSVLKYDSLHSMYFDLGIFLSDFYNLIYYNEWWRTGGGHFQPLMLFWSIIFVIFPIKIAPFIVLSLQGILLALPMVWLVRRYGYLPSLAFALYFPLWYVALNDFHMDNMVVPLLFGFYFLVDQKRVWLAVLCASCMALVKEPFALQTAACGIYLFIVTRKTFASVFLLVFGFSIFHIAVNYIIPYFASGARGALDSTAYAWLGSSMTDTVAFALKNPLVVIKSMFSPPAKIYYYLIVLFGALAFIPLLRPVMLIPAFPIIAISMLSKINLHYTLGTHYGAGLIAPFIMAFAKGLPIAQRYWNKMKLQDKWFVPMITAIIVIGHIMSAPSPMFKVFWLDKHWDRSYKAYIPTARDTMIKDAIQRSIPIDPDTVVSTENDLNWGHIAYRRHMVVYPDGVVHPVHELDQSNRSMEGLIKFIATNYKTPDKYREIWAEYVLLDLKRPYFIGGEGCDWHYGKCYDKDISQKFLNLLEQSRKRYDTVYENDGFMILKRKLHGYG